MPVGLGWVDYSWCFECLSVVIQFHGLSTACGLLSFLIKSSENAEMRYSMCLESECV